MIANQFLLNPDGSAPEGVDLDQFTALGIRLVVPTARPTIPQGKIAVETDPEQDNGQWHQKWVLADAPTITPEPVTVITAVQFMERISIQKLAAVVTATKTDVMAQIWYDKLLAASEVDLNDARVRDGVAYMVANGILTQADAEAL